MIMQINSFLYSLFNYTFVRSRLYSSNVYKINYAIQSDFGFCPKLICIPAYSFVLVLRCRLTIINMHRCHYGRQYGLIYLIYNKQEFRSRLIIAFVDNFALSQSECVIGYCR